MCDFQEYFCHTLPSAIWKKNRLQKLRIDYTFKPLMKNHTFTLKASETKNCYTYIYTLTFVNGGFIVSTSLSPL